MTEAPNPTLTVDEALRRWPHVAGVFVQWRLACPGCAMAPFDTLRDVAQAYEVDLNGLLEDVERAAGTGWRRRKEMMEMSPTEALKHEHRVVLMVLEGAEREAAAIKAGAAVHTEKVEQMVDFFKNFVDRCHHAKEERHLFPALAAKGFSPDSGPVAVMLHEHEQGRAAVRAIAAALPGARAGDRKAALELSDALLGYAELLRAHIFKEDNVLFPMADQVLPADEQAQLAGAFDQVEREEIGPGVHERYHRLAHELAGE